MPVVGWLDGSFGRILLTNYGLMVAMVDPNYSKINLMETQ